MRLRALLVVGQTPMSKTLRNLTIALLLLTSGVALTVPTAQAHKCSAQYPAQECGSCRDVLPHEHRYADGKLYCESSPVASVIALLEGDDQIGEISILGLLP